MAVVAMPDTEFGPLQPHNAGGTGLDHLNRSADAQAQFLQALDFRRWPQKLVDAGPFARIEYMEREGILHGRLRSLLRRNLKSMLS
jgi:hypothetical protein